MQELLQALRGLPAEQLQAVLNLAQQELADRTGPLHGSDYSEGEFPLEKASEPQEIPEEVIDLLRDLYNQCTDVSENIRVVIPVEVEVTINCSIATGDQNCDMDMDCDVWQWPDNDELLKNKEVKALYNKIHQGVMNFRSKVGEVAKKYGQTVDDIIYDL